MAIDVIVETEGGEVFSFPPSPWSLEVVGLSGHPYTLADWKDKPADEQKRLREESSVLIVRAWSESMLKGRLLHAGPHKDCHDLQTAVFQSLATAGLGAPNDDGEMIPDRLPGDPICVSLGTILENLREREKEGDES